MGDLKSDVVVAAFDDGVIASRALHKLLATGFKPDDLSFVGKASCSNERVLGWTDRGHGGVKFWGIRSTLWEYVWALFGGGLFLTTPVMGPTFMMGRIGAFEERSLDAGVIIGGMTAIGTALLSMGLPRNDAEIFDDLVARDRFLLMVHGSALDVNLASANLASSAPPRLMTFPGIVPRSDLAA